MQLSLDNKRLDIAFLICFLLTISAPIIVPMWRLTFFAPFLVMACYKKKLTQCLWLAFFCGLFLDLLSTHSRLGLHSLDFCLTIALIYPQRRNFFADSVSTLPIMTFGFAFVSTLIMALLLYSMESRNVFSWSWVVTDLLVMPLLDATYAFCGFSLLPLLFGKPQRRGKDYFLSVNHYNGK